jgi:dihydroflavonol-4-reductase
VLTYAHVDDIAEVNIRAAERGRAGENYILAGPALSFGELFNLWSDITGLPAPALRLPSALLRPLAPVAGLAGKMLPIPEMYSQEFLRIMGATYIGSSAKAHSELGWETRSLREGMAETFAWIAGNTGPAPESWPSRNRGVLVGAAAGMVLAFLLYRLATRDRRG